MDTDWEYFYDCSRYCETCQMVSKQTYFAHALHCCNQLQNALNNYLSQHDANTALGEPEVDEEPEVMLNNEWLDNGDNEGEGDLDAPNHMQHGMDDNLDNLYANYMPNAGDEVDVDDSDVDSEVGDQDISVDNNASTS